jgi:hypothetical protein
VPAQCAWLANETHVFTVGEVNKSKWRLNVTANDGGNYVVFSEVQMHTEIGGADVCGGGFTQASSRYDRTGSYGPQRAVDDDSATDYYSDGGIVAAWWYYEFGRTVEVVEYSLRADSTYGDQSSAPRDWTLEYWDGSQWVVADTQTGQTGWASGETRTFSFVTGPPSNTTPVVEAGPDQTIPLASTATATLAGSATDDGLPDPPAALTFLWTVVSSPSGSTVTFTDDADPTTDVEFDSLGEYVLRLTADDGELTGHDDVTITVVAPGPVSISKAVAYAALSAPGGISKAVAYAVLSTEVRVSVSKAVAYAVVQEGVSNEAPVVDAGSDQSIPIASPTATLAGSATDDGKPDPPAALTYLWTQQLGPGTATFVDATDPGTDVSFDEPGVYVLSLTADDSALTGYDEITITVVLPAPDITVITPDVGSIDGGTTVVLDGAGFLTGATVTFDGDAPTDVVVVSSTQITCVTPAHAIGQVDVVVTNTDSQFDTLVNGYLYLVPPTVTSVAPTYGPSVGGTAVTITGTNFGAGATVSFGGALAHDVVIVSGTEITCTTPAHAGGLVAVTVTNVDEGFGTLLNAFRYYNSAVFVTIDTGSGPDDWTDYVGLEVPRIELVMNGRSTATVVLTKDAPSIPPRYSKVLIYDVATGESLFGGFIENRTIEPYEDTIHDFYITCQLSDCGLLWDSCLVNLAYAAPTTPEDVLDDLVTKYLNPRFDTVYAKVTTGYTLQPTSWVNKTASSVLRDLNTKCGVAYYITPNNEILAFAPGTLRAPYDITDAAPHSKKVTWTDSDQTPANNIVVELSTPVVATEVFDTPGVTDGDYQYFETTFPCSQNSSDMWPRALVVDGASVVGVLFSFPTATYPWGWDYINHRLVCDTRYATPPGAGHVVSITYAIAAVVVTSGETPQMDALISEDVAMLDAEEVGIEKLRVLNQSPRTITIISFESGWAPGQTGDITRTNRGLVGASYLISNVVLELQEGHWTRTITGLENAIYQGSYIDQWKSIMGEGGSGSTPTPPPVIPPETPPDPPVPAPITHSTSANTLTVANVADLGPYASTGRQITVTFGFSFTGYTRYAPDSMSSYDAATKQNPGAQLLLQRSVGGGAFATVATITVTNGTHIEESPNSGDPGSYTQIMSGGGTYADPDLSTDTREYKLIFNSAYGTGGWLNVNTVVSPSGYGRKNTLSIQSVEQ